MHLSDLQPGQQIQVKKQFDDFDGQRIMAGTTWTFLNYDYFPYDDGYTFKFNEGDWRLAGIFTDNANVMKQFDEYFTRID